MEKTKKVHDRSLADNIVSRRIALGYRSAEAFAEKADVPYPTLRDIEAGYSMGRTPTIQKIAEALGCSMDDLYKKQKPETTRPSPLINEIISILTTMNQSELESALAGVTAIRNSSARRGTVQKKKGAR